MKQKNNKKAGFTLVELVVSVGIAALLMMGMAAFFSSTFRSMFTERMKVAGAQGQVVVSAALQKRFMNTQGLQDSGNDYLVLQNDTKDGTLPFTYVGTDADDHIIFKDFFVFNGMAGNVNSSSSPDLDNPAGLALVGGNYFVAAPLENEVYQCDLGLSNCSALNLSGLSKPLKQPMDVTAHSDGRLYITDAGNNRIVEVTDPGGTNQAFVLTTSDLNFPTGIQFYSYAGPPAGDYLFVADTYNNQVKKIDLSDDSYEVVVGGNDPDCGRNPADNRDHTAVFCELNFPTGLVIGTDSDGEALFIADTGNRRVLRVGDPKPPANNGNTEQIELDFESDVSPGKIVFGTFEGEIFDGSSMAGVENLNTSYDNVSHELTLDPILSTYSGPCGWTPAGNTLWTNDDPSSILSNGDLIAMENGSSGEAVIYEVANVPSNDTLACSIPLTPPNTAYYSYKITLNKNLEGVSLNQPIYRAAKSGDSETIDLDFSNATFPQKGFQMIDIEMFDFDQTTSIQTLQHFVRIGDGELGTKEDVVTIYNDSYTNSDYPTGLGWNAFDPEVATTAVFDRDAFSDLDYVSSFETLDFQVETLDFTGDLSDELLQLTFKARLGDDPGGDPIWKDYSLSASLK